MKIPLHFTAVKPFKELTNFIGPDVYSGIYIWGFKFPTDFEALRAGEFLPYYVGIADKISIAERLTHHYYNLDTTYTIFNKFSLTTFYRYLDDSALPKVKENYVKNPDVIFYKNEKNNGKSKDALNSKDHIDFYRDHFHFTYASYRDPNKEVENQKRTLEFLETFVKYSLENRTISKSQLAINGDIFKNARKKYEIDFKTNNGELIFKSNPSLTFNKFKIKYNEQT